MTMINTQTPQTIGFEKPLSRWLYFIHAIVKKIVMNKISIGSVLVIYTPIL